MNSVKDSARSEVRDMLWNSAEYEWSSHNEVRGDIAKILKRHSLIQRKITPHYVLGFSDNKCVRQSSWQNVQRELMSGEVLWRRGRSFQQYVVLLAGSPVLVPLRQPALKRGWLKETMRGRAGRQQPLRDKIVSAIRCIWRNVSDSTPAAWQHWKWKSHLCLKYQSAWPFTQASWITLLYCSSEIKSDSHYRNLANSGHLVSEFSFTEFIQIDPYVRPHKSEGNELKENKW